MRKHILMLLMVGSSLLVGCNKTPDYVLNADTMAAIITDLQLHDAACQQHNISAIYDAEVYTHYYNQIFEKYSVTPEKFDSSLIWYTKNNISTLRDIYKKVDSNIDNMMEEQHVEK